MGEGPGAVTLTPTDRARGAVLVTGAARGIGRATVVELAGRGYAVLAGVRSLDDGRALQATHPGVIPLLLDLTRTDHLAGVAHAVAAAAGPGGLRGVVNNAGIVVAGPLEFLPPEALREQLEVNVVGTLALTQAVLPALRRAGGRIVNVSSVNGRLATPFTGAYAASKFALEALSDALRRELARAGVDVVVIQPGAFRSDLRRAAHERARRIAARYPPEAHRLYGSVLARLAEAPPQKGGDPARVARVIARALEARRPRTRYVVGRDARLGTALAALLPDRVVDRLLALRLRKGSARRPERP